MAPEMAKHDFSDPERYAVYTVHGERCYLCREPIDLFTMEVDHIIPETLLDEPVELAKVLAEFGLPGDFDLESYQNWMPSCRPCNNRKKAMVFRPAPIILVELQKAAEKAGKAAERAEQLVSAQVASRAWNTIKRAAADGVLSPFLRAEITEFAGFHIPKREPEVAGAPFRLAPGYVIDGALDMALGPLPLRATGSVAPSSDE
jgi:5-methylcytosine-specific restriction endonuclease McrA